MNKPYSRAAIKFYCFSAVLEWSFSDFETTRAKINSVEISPINDRSPICFHLNRLGNGNDDISSEEHFENSTKTEVLLYYLN
jgi:hypothetical protein